MPTTTNFDDFLNNLFEDDIETIYCLYESIQGETSMGSFTTSKKNGKLFVKADDNNLTLMLSTKEAVKGFLNILDYKYGGDFGWVGGNYEFVRSMNKD